MEPTTKLAGEVGVIAIDERVGPAAVEDEQPAMAKPKVAINPTVRQ